MNLTVVRIVVMVGIIFFTSGSFLRGVLYIATITEGD